MYDVRVRVLDNDGNIDTDRTTITVTTYERCGEDCRLTEDCGNRPFVRGDAFSDAVVNVGDVAVILNLLFRGETKTLDCEKAGDIDDSGSLEITDVVFLLRYLFSDSPPPPAPFPECSDDPTQDALSCASPLPCSE